jgi:hypothetical protein
MAVVIAILVLVLVGLVVLVVGAPLRRAAQSPAEESESAREAVARRDELEAARDAKYREIRDTEMDFRTGKLSAQDYGVLDAELRAEALVILDALQALEARSAQPQDA